MVDSGSSTAVEAVSADPVVMQASVLRNSAFHLEDVPVPEPGPGEVLVKVAACGICGSDLHTFKHQTDLIDKVKAMGADASELERAYSEGVILGHEFVGEVVKFGPATQQALAVGDRVVSMPFVLKNGVPALVGSVPELSGAYAQYMVLTEALLLPVDKDIPSEAAAFVEPLGIAVHAVAKSGISAGDIAVVVGAGPIGLAIIAVLKARGIETVVASDLSEKRRELATTMGATKSIDGSQESVIAVASALGGTSRMFVYENTGAPGMLGNLVLEAPQAAHITMTGIPAGEESFVPMMAISKELSMSFVIYYSPEEFAEALGMIGAGQFNWQALHTGTVGLDGISQAFTNLADPELHAKILIDPWQRA
ncbi:MAG: zinc-binding dehydrogenase [Pseudomonadota bacterium]